ncbi:MAG: ISAzo13 family transposase, partial [Candidatus Bathyarchaeota archaeon]|nr:ISAzo13 family transposase [Candidatus Termiticorpusculum sp.]
DIARNEGFVNLGLSHDTSEFAVASILRWWQTLGVNTYPNASKIYITSDNGGSNGSRLRLWKKQLQEFANISGLSVVVSHFPPGTSKWNKIEHKMFCYISKNWRGVPLISVETVIALISNTTTFKGLRIVCIRDNRCYALGTKVSDEEIAQLNLERNKFHGDWNYTIHPK